MSDPFFSIIIPTYNRADFILKTIDSVLNQEFKKFEIIIVDDGSSDGTFDIVNGIENPRLRCFRKENGERGAARNYGGRKAKGKYITFLDSDDLFYSDHLNIVFNYISSFKELKICFQQYEIIEESGKSKIHYIPKQNPINLELVKRGNFMSCQGIFIRRDIFLQNQFNEDRKLAGSEDYELWLRLSARFPIFYSSKITSALVEHDDRSVKNISFEKLIERKSLMLTYLKNDQKFIKEYRNEFALIEANALLYMALHLSLQEKKYFSTVLQYLLKAMSKNLGILKARSFYATLYHLFFS